MNNDLISKKSLIEAMKKAEAHGLALGDEQSVMAAAAIAGMREYIVQCAPAVQTWISVKDERKPKDRRNYFIAYVFGNSDMHFFGEAKYHAYEGNGIVDRPHFSNEGVGGMRVTHWMEIPKLPQPPKGE